MTDPNYVGYEKLLAEMDGQPLTTSEIEARLTAAALPEPEQPPQDRVPCPCGHDASVPPGTQETRCLRCRSFLAWTAHGWAALGLRPPNVLCPTCGKRFGVPSTRPDKDGKPHEVVTATCYTCNTRFKKTGGQWRALESPMTIAHATALNEHIENRYIIA